MLTPFLLHTRYTEQSVNCFKIGCFSFEKRLRLHIAFAQAAHNRRKPAARLRVILGRAVAVQSESDAERKNSRYQRAVEGLRSSSKVHASRGC